MAKIRLGVNASHAEEHFYWKNPHLSPSFLYHYRMPITRKELDAQPGCVQVICRSKAHKPPRLFHVEMPDQSKTIWFWAADEFKDFTNWPERGQEIYDIYQGKFIPLHTGATYPKCAWYPHFITKPVALPERDALHSYMVA